MICTPGWRRSWTSIGSNRTRVSGRRSPISSTTGRRSRSFCGNRARHWTTTLLMPQAALQMECRLPDYAAWLDLAAGSTEYWHERLWLTRHNPCGLLPPAIALDKEGAHGDG